MQHNRATSRLSRAGRCPHWGMSYCCHINNDSHSINGSTDESALISLPKTPIFPPHNASLKCPAFLFPLVPLELSNNSRSPGKRKRSLSLQPHEDDFASTSEVFAVSSSPPANMFYSDCQIATPSLRDHRASETPPSSPSSAGSLSPVTPHSSFRQFPFPRFGQASPSKHSDLPYIPSVAYDLMTQMAKDDLFYDNAEAMKIQAELFAKASSDSDPESPLACSRNLFGPMPVKTPVKSPKLEVVSPDWANTLRRRRLSWTSGDKKHRPCYGYEDDLLSDDDERVNPSSRDRLLPQRLFRKELFATSCRLDLDSKPTIDDVKTSQTHSPLQPTPLDPDTKRTPHPQDRDAKLLDGEAENGEAEKPLRDVKTAGPKGDHRAPSLGLPISISGGLLQAAKRIVSATSQCSMTAASVMLNCPKKRVKGSGRDAVKTRVREKQFAAKLSASGELLESSRNMVS